MIILSRLDMPFLQHLSTIFLKLVVHCIVWLWHYVMLSSLIGLQGYSIGPSTLAFQINVTISTNNTILGASPKEILSLNPSTPSALSSSGDHIHPGYVSDSFVPSTSS